MECVSTAAARPLGRAAAASALWVALTLSGCGSRWVPEDSLRARLSPEAVLLAVPRVAQGGGDPCGLACLEAVLAYHGLRTAPEDRDAFGLETAGQGAVRAGEIRDQLRRNGLHAVLVHGSLDREYPTGILGLLEKGLPILVEVVVTNGVDASHHYVLVVGFEPRRQWIFILDPARGLGGLSYDAFEDAWARADHLMLVAAPRGRT